MRDYNELVLWGWGNYFQQQLSLDELESYSPARVIEQHRSSVTVVSSELSFDIQINSSMPELTVGDWVLIDDDSRFYRLLNRKTCFRRKSPGSKSGFQLISANVDTAFIVCSINEDFNLNRIERYLSLVYEAGAEPVVLLSKIDLFDSSEEFVSKVRAIDKKIVVESVNCLDFGSLDKLNFWMSKGNTISVLGSSGVGKSTLVNTLLNSDHQSTGTIREDDGKGRHTTTRRSLIKIPLGGLIIDSPGMREIQLAECEDGIRSTFHDIEVLAGACRYSDCSHQTEPGCTVRDAVESGDLDQRRLENYLKLLRENAMNSLSTSEKREIDKKKGKFYKYTLSETLKIKGR